MKAVYDADDKIIRKWRKTKKSRGTLSQLIFAKLWEEDPIEQFT